MLTRSERLRKYLLLIEEEKHLSTEAVELRAKLDNTMGADHPELQRADRRIAQIPALKALRKT